MAVPVDPSMLLLWTFTVRLETWPTCGEGLMLMSLCPNERPLQLAVELTKVLPQSAGAGTPNSVSLMVWKSLFKLVGGQANSSVTGSRVDPALRWCTRETPT
jgi:hypothetical protein